MQRSNTLNQWLEHPSHLEQILEHVRSGFLPLKYAYAGSAAFTHDTLARTTGYASVIGDARHEVATLRRARPQALPGQIVEIGPGNGTHTTALFDTADQLLPGPARPRRYLGLDFSSTLLGLAAERLAESRPDLEVSTAHWDMESGPTTRIEAWRRGAQPVLACVLGHMLGNLADPGQALRNLALSLRPGDSLLASLTLYRSDCDEDAILDPYRTEAFTDAVLEPLRAAACAQANPRLTLRLVGRTVIGEAQTDPATTVRCFTSIRFLPHEALSLLSSPTGWGVTHWATDEGDAHMALVARCRNLRGVDTP